MRKKIVSYFIVLSLFAFQFGLANNGYVDTFYISSNVSINLTETTDSNISLNLDNTKQVEKDYIQNTYPTPLLIAPNIVFYISEDVLDTFYTTKKNHFNTVYVFDKVLFFPLENFDGNILYLQNILFDRHSTIGQNFHTKLNQNTETNQVTLNTYFIQSNGSSSQDFFHNKFYAVGIPAPSYHFSKNATAIDAAHLKIIAAKKQNFGYHAATKNFFLEINFHNRPPPRFLS